MKELLIDLTHDSGKALYEQIYEHICKEIADGKISPGEKLPSTRFMAKNLQISRSTVELAYDQLVAEGYLQAKPCAGYFACDISELYQWKAEPAKENGETPKQEALEECGIVFSPFQVDRVHFPFHIWQKLNRSINMEDDEKYFFAGDSRGDEELRSAIASYLHRARGVNCDARQIILGAGNEYLLLLLSQLLGSNQVVAMEKYTYIQAARAFSNMEYLVSAVDMDENGMMVRELREMGADIAYVMPSHQFPLGTVMPMKRRLELLKWASEVEKRYIIEDDHDSEFRYKGRPIPSLQGTDGAGKVIYLGTFSKSIAPSLRVSYMVLPKPLLEKYNQNCGFYATTVPRTQQELLYRFLADGGFERHLNRMKNVYKGKQDILLSLLKKEYWVRRIYGENAGLHLLVEVDTRLTEAELLTEAGERGVKLFGLSDYRLPHVSGVGKLPTLLMGFGCLDEKKMAEGIKIIREIVKQSSD